MIQVKYLCSSIVYPLCESVNVSPGGMGVVFG